MDSVFLNLVRGNRMSAYMGFQSTEGKPYRNAPDYSYIEIPLDHMYNSATEEVQEKALRNQHIKLIPACKLDIRGSYKVLVIVNPALQEVSTCPSMMLLEPGDRGAPSFYATFRKDMAVGDLNWVVRLYMLA